MKAFLRAMLVFAAIQAAAFATVIGGLQREVRAARAEVQAAKERYLARKKVAVNLDLYRDQLREVDRRFGESLEALPNRTDESFAGVGAAAVARGLQIDFLSIGSQESWRGPYAERAARVVVTGRFHDVAAFMADLTRLPGSLLLDAFLIGRAAAPGLVTMKASVRAFRFVSGEERAERRGAPPPERREI